MCQSLDNNQALVDGNKRLAWLTTKVFLAINGQQLGASAHDGERFMVESVAGHSDLELIAGWLAEALLLLPNSPDLPDRRPPVRAF